MKPIFIAALISLILTACSPSSSEAPAVNQVADSGTGLTYLFVHGASGGGWDWRTMEELLEAEGQAAYRPTLTGLGDRMHLNSPQINLTTHINDIVNVILFEDLQDLVLVGHSYGGMVITGVMNRIPGRIKHAVFLDAAAPGDGMSAADLWGEGITNHRTENGIVYFSWLDPEQAFPRDVPQSLQTLTEPVSFNNPEALKTPVTFIAYIGEGQTRAERAQDPSWKIAEERGWNILTLESDHNAQRSHPQELTALLLAAPKDTPKIHPTAEADTPKIRTRPAMAYLTYTPSDSDLIISRQAYANRLHGFWLGQCVANWTGLVTEMDKIGGEGPHGKFYTREDWGRPDQPNIWSDSPSHLSANIDWVLEDEDGMWGADDDTDIEYIYQELLLRHQTSLLSGEQIRDGWLRHIYSDENTPFVNGDGSKENYLWVSNQQAHDLMRLENLAPPATSDPEHNPHYDMIDAQLTTEIFGLFAPARPDVALRMAHLPIRTTARENAAWASEFYVVMHSLASLVDQALPMKERIMWMADAARQHLPEESYTAKMFDFVKSRYESGVPWEQARDDIYKRYQVEQLDGYDITSRDLDCNGCFASGINFASSIVSLLYGEGDFKETVKIAVLAGWDSDNPAATWGGLLGFMIGKEGIEEAFGMKLADRFNIHRTRGGFPNDGIDSLGAMAGRGILVIDRVVQEQMGGGIDLEEDQWYIPVTHDPAGEYAPGNEGN